MTVRVAVLGALTAATMAGVQQALGEDVEIVHVGDEEELRALEQREMRLEREMRRPEPLEIRCGPAREVMLPVLLLSRNQRDYPHTAGALRRQERNKGRGRRR